MDAVADRDYVSELLAALSIISIHISRLAEEWVLWTTDEFQFLKMDDSVSTGSSMMPQKKNPDPMELARGKSARVIGSLTTLLILLKGLPLTYNRDLQEDKEPLFDAIETFKDVVEMTAEFAQNITYNRAAIAARIDSGFLDATTLADYLVTKGLPFRSSHHVVGSLVAACTAKNIRKLADLPLSEMQAHSALIQADVFDWLGAENAVGRFQSYGSTGKAQVAAQLAEWKAKLDI
jgi:argininosuccinate lyase